jgi:RNA polymerase sigma-70 factor (ECF subfamily)
MVVRGNHDPTGVSAPESIGCVTDEELVALARTGDADAFDQLVIRHQAGAYRAALAALRNPQDAEEAAQDALIRAWSSLGRFRGESAFRTWLLTIVWNCALSRRRSVALWFKRKAPIDDAMAMAEGAASPYREARDREMRAHVASAIELLTPKLRDALLLAQSGDYGYDEIAQALKIPVGTLKWRVSEARKQVKGRLQGLGYVDAG